MSGRGATHRGRYRPRLDQIARSRAGQRNRRKDRWDGKLCDVSLDRLQDMVRKCRAKTPHATKGAAWQAKLAAEREFGVPTSIYECPICGKWHLTTHPWRKER